MAVLLDLLVRTHVLELAVGELGRRARLEGASEKQLRGQKGSELHVEARARSGHVTQVWLMDLVVYTLGVDGGDIPTARVPVGKARDVGSKGAMREAGLSGRGLRGVAEAA